MNLPEVNVKKILFATDLSDGARHAFAYAASLANLYAADLLLLHVMDETPELVDKHVSGYIDADQWEAIKAKHFQEAQSALIGKKRDHFAIREVLDQFVSNVKSSAPVTAFKDEVLVVRGNPVEKILETSAEQGCDMIVMGTNGQSALADVMLGSTARRVVRRSPKPVLVVRIPED